MSGEVVADLVGRRDAAAGPEVWEEFQRRFGWRIEAGIRSALRRAGKAATPDRVEDLAQEVYCRLLENGGRRLRRCRAREEGQVGAFLRRAAENLVLDELRARGAFKRGRDRVKSWGLIHATYLAEQVADGRRSPEERLLLSEKRRLFLRRCRRAVSDRTPSRDVEILRLAILEGWTSREIAARTRLSPSSVDSLVHRTKRKLAREGLTIPRRLARPGMV